MSSALDEDTQRAIADGRETAGAMLRSAQKDLQKVFIVFLVGFLGTFYALRLYVWEFFRNVTERRMNELTQQSFDIIAQTPFDVILLQAKISLVAGVIIAIPIFVYFSRDALRDRDLWPQAPVPIWKLVAIGTLAVVLFLLGMAYGYFVFFPFMFEFLAGNAVAAGFAPTWSIVMWAQFIFLLTMSFGFAAQMPLFVTGLSYAEIVPYETFREKWRYAVVLIFVFGAFFSPPDPFTQIMWAVPLLFLYGFSLYLAKFTVTMRRGSERLDVKGTVAANWNLLAALLVGGAAATWLFYRRGGREVVNGVLASAGSDYGFYPVDDLTGASAQVDLAVTGVLVGLLFVVAGFLYLSYRELERAVGPAGAPATMGDPTAIDLATLDEAGVRAAPPEAFEAMTEAQALDAARSAIDDGDHEKAQAILDRYDEAHPDGQQASGAGGGVDEGGFLEEDLLVNAPGRLAALRTLLARGHRRIDWRRRYRERWPTFLGAALLAVAAVYVGVRSRFGEYLNDAVIPGLPYLGPDVAIPNVEDVVMLPRDESVLLVSALAALFGVVLVGLYYAYTRVRAGLDPAVFDLDRLDVEEVRRAPLSGMRRLDRAEIDRAVRKADLEGNAAKGTAIRERYAAATAGPDPDVPAYRAHPLLPEAGVVRSIRRGSGWVNWRSRFRTHWNLLAGIAVLGFGAGYALTTAPETVSRYLSQAGFGSVAVPDLAVTFGGEQAALAAVAVATLLGLGVLVALFALYVSYSAGRDPTAIDVETLSTDELRRAPPSLFAAMPEGQANYLADRALRAGDDERASVVYERYDAAHTADATDATEDATDSRTDADAPEPGSVGDRATRASGTFLDELTEGERDEDDIGGYYTDIAFIVDTLTSKTFRIVGVFMLVLAGVFAWLYTGGIGAVYAGFLRRVPGEVLEPGQTASEAAKVIALHPVEALIFEVKFSTLVAAIVTVPLIAYYAWPALRERGFVRGHRRVIFGWVGVLLVGLAGGLVLGYYYVAPAVISYLVADALAANMVISYRISDFFWLIFFTTAGIGLLFDIPVLMVLLNTAGVSYQAMRSRWREVTVAILLVAALFTPADIITMFLVTIPLMVAYGVGVGVLFVLTLGGRRNLRKPIALGSEAETEASS